MSVLLWTALSDLQWTSPFTFPAPWRTWLGTSGPWNWVMRVICNTSTSSDIVQKHFPCQFVLRLVTLWRVRKTATASFITSVRPHATARRIFVEILNSGLPLKSSEKIQVRLKQDKKNRQFIWNPAYVCHWSLYRRQTVFSVRYGSRPKK
jgi:hypothetical protein